MYLIFFQVLVIATVASGNVWPHTVLLNDGNRIPVPSFGTVGKADLVDVVLKSAVIQAIEAGYRQIDTAAAYLNEEQIGEAIADVISRGIVTREELWITTKVVEPCARFVQIATTLISTNLAVSSSTLYYCNSVRRVGQSVKFLALGVSVFVHMIGSALTAPLVLHVHGRR